MKKLLNIISKTSLVERALTHKSYDNIINNEKLEFLGDRVLGLVISEKLLEKFLMRKRYYRQKICKSS